MCRFGSRHKGGWRLVSNMDLVQGVALGCVCCGRHQGEGRGQLPWPRRFCERLGDILTTAAEEEERKCQASARTSELAYEAVRNQEEELLGRVLNGEGGSVVLEVGVGSKRPMYLRGLDGHWFRGRGWTEVSRGRFRTPLHVNLGEAEALNFLLRDIVKVRAFHGKRLLDFADSQVVLGVAGKGRASAFQLLRRSRRLSALIFAANLDLGARWVISKKNPADGPSRRRGGQCRAGCVARW